LQTALASGPCNIDLSEVSFIDSSGLGVMVRAKKLAKQQQQELWFVAPQIAVRNVLHLARLERLLLNGNNETRSRRRRPASLEPSPV
jgi:anti-anti-sigma factor